MRLLHNKQMRNHIYNNLGVHFRRFLVRLCSNVWQLSLLTHVHRNKVWNVAVRHREKMLKQSTEQKIKPRLISVFHESDFRCFYAESWIRDKPSEIYQYCQIGPDFTHDDCCRGYMYTFVDPNEPRTSNMPDIHAKGPYLRLVCVATSGNIL